MDEQGMAERLTDEQRRANIALADALARDAHEQDLAQPEGSYERARALAQEIGKRHGRAASSWIELDADLARRIVDGEREATEITQDMSGPLSGEYADGYTVEQLASDCELEPDRAGDFDYEVADELGREYEDVYWASLIAEIERRAADIASE